MYTTYAPRNARYGARPAASNRTPATPAQMAFLGTLLKDLALLDGENAANLHSSITAPGFTKAAASAHVDLLKTLISKARAEARAAAPVVDGATMTPLCPGMYRKDGVLIKVQAARGTGNMYGKALVGSPEEGYAFAYTPGATRGLTQDHRLTVDQAKAWGRETGTCCNCGALLTDPVSVEAGIGPICAGRI